MPETWVLIVWLFAAGGRLDWERTPGLSESVCNELAWEVDPARGVAKCIRWGTTRPWPPPPGFERPRSPSYDCANCFPLPGQAGLSLMEPFTLILWLMMGQRFEQTQDPEPGPGQMHRPAADDPE